MKQYKPHYEIEEIYENTYKIADSGLGQGKVYMYLLVGSEKALLIDSGYGLLDLKAVIATLTDKPCICVCTHGHLDHALGACQFEDAYIHSNDFEVYKQHTSPELITTFGMSGLLFKPPKWIRNNPSYQNLVTQMAQKDYAPLRAIDDIPSFDLGGRTVTWRNIIGHTQGTIAIIDEAHNTAFDADAGAPGAWLFLPESSPLPEYKTELKNYRDFMQEKGITRRYVGHSGKALGKKYIDNLIRCVEISIAKPKKGIKVKSALGDVRIVFAGGSLIFCRR